MSTDLPTPTPAEDPRPTDQLRGPWPQLPAVDHLPKADQIAAILDHQRAGWDEGVAVRARRYLEEYEVLRDDLLGGAAVIFQEYFRQRRKQPCAPFADYLRDYPRHADALRELLLADQLAEAMVPMSTAATPATQRRIGDYQLEEEIGRGGMGVVWKARQISLGRFVALKLIRDGALSSLAAVERLRQEARAAASLQHPNIVAVHEVGEEGGQHFIAMELVEGPTLAAVVNENPLPAKEAARIVEAIAQAVQHAHDRGVVHRDIKPANVLLASSVRAGSVSDGSAKPVADASGSDGMPKITDFGLARQLEAGQSLTATVEVLGTPSYMPPEQARGECAKVGPASDVYSLGATLYEVLTRRPPFSAATPVDTLRQVIESEPISPRTLNANIPRDLETICLKCLQKEIPARYSSAQALADDLARFQRGEPVQARPVGRLTHGWRWCRRNTMVAGLAAGLLLTLMVGLGSVLWQLRRVEHQRIATERERDRAQANLVKAKDAVNFIGRRIGEIGLKHVPQVQEVQREVLEYALKFQEGFLEEEGDDLAVRLEVIKACVQVGEIHATLGAIAKSEAAFRRAIHLVEKAPDDFPSILERHQILINGYGGLSKLFQQAKRNADVVVTEKVLDRLFASYPVDHQLDVAYRQQLAIFLQTKASRRTFPREGAALSQQALALIRPLTKEYPDNWRFKEQLAKCCGTFAVHLKRLDRLDEAQVAYDEARLAQEELVARMPGNASLQFDLANTMRNLVPLCRVQKKYATAEKIAQRGEGILAKLIRDYPAVPLYHSFQGANYHNLALVRLEMGRSAEALDLLEKAATCQRRALEPDAKNYAYRELLCKHSYQLADLHLNKGDHEPAARAANEMAAVAVTTIDYFAAAGLFARCGVLTGRDGRFPMEKRAELAGKYDAEAMRILRPMTPDKWHSIRPYRDIPELAPLYRFEEFKSRLQVADITAPKK